MIRKLTNGMTDNQANSPIQDSDPGRVSGPPRVSIALPVHNGMRYLPRTLKLILAQTFTDFELLIFDNASTDGTTEFCRAVTDPRVRYVRRAENVGAVANFNRAFEGASAPYFIWAAHDDEWAPTYLQRCVEALDADSDAVVACSSVRYIDEDGREAGPFRDNFDTRGLGRLDRVRRIFSGTTYNWVYGLIRSDALRKTGMIRHVWGGDTMLVLELALLGPFVKVDKPLFSYRVFRRKTVKDVQVTCDPRAVHPAPFWQMLASQLRVAPPDVRPTLLWTILMRNRRWRFLLARDAWLWIQSLVARRVESPPMVAPKLSPTKA